MLQQAIWSSTELLYLFGHETDSYYLVSIFVILCILLLSKELEIAVVLQVDSLTNDTDQKGYLIVLVAREN
jgi:hypothetical protein